MDWRDRCLSVFLISWAMVLLPHCLSGQDSMSAAELEDLKAVPAEVIVHSSPCSTTCGLGLRTQELCPLRQGQVHRGKDCFTRKVGCMDSWQCGLQDVTVSAGQRLDLDCLGEVMEAMGRFSFRVSWRYARGVVTTDDSLLRRWVAPRLDRLVLDPVLPREALTLNFPSALANWDRRDLGYHGNITVVKDGEDLYDSTAIRDIVLISLGVAGVTVGLFFLGFCRKSRGVWQHLYGSPELPHN
ncbi:hypothetical protein DPEC_G00016110 [Dallia pectoralis]|uniref:Uncharacterized protein n=1 Tax=Dallia pectoralis TaxID=75939 RepID=A0ACC2HN69_DALPE|nr:hypothetical protein DPEC_G00016110 [Dallia pectoralis]